MNREELLVLTLDAGGTNLVFSAVENGIVLRERVHLPTRSADLDEFLKKLITGFSKLRQKLNKEISAISFCFPGPADYDRGIIGDLENLPFFRGGVPLSRMLENEFHVPVFINNDGDLFALGEALHGLLPAINSRSEKKYRNLLGVTLGTGFGGGIVQDKRLYRGDNSAGGEVNRMSNFLDRSESVEEVLSIRGLKHLYAQYSGTPVDKVPEPFEIYQIGKGEAEGKHEAALEAWKVFGRVLGDALANAVSLTDSCVVIGGGLSGAHELFLQHTVDQMNSYFQKKDNSQVPRMEMKAFNWENMAGQNDFLRNDAVMIDVPFSSEKQQYFPIKKIALGINRLGTSESVALGAYAFAANHL
jgi:glucokinase